MAFLPPQPATPVAEPLTATLPPPPAIAPRLFTKDSLPPLLAQPPLPVRGEAQGGRIAGAEARFQAGKRLYLEGEIERARREFDAAIDLLLSSPGGLAKRPGMEKRLQELVDLIHRYDVEGLGAGSPEQEPIFERSPLEEIIEMTFPVDPRLRTKVTEEVQATVSQLPLQENDAVLSYINYFTSEKGRRTLISGLRRAGRYRPLISRVLDEEGVPQELIHLAQAESGFQPRAVSRKAATGMWQFVQARGREYGLIQSNYHDDRLDPEQATRAAARHLRDLYNTFGDWYLAIAAYNCGPGAVERAVERTGYADFWELHRRNVLPKETRNYVPIILAMTIMVKNARDYGLENIDPDPPVEYDTIGMSAATNLSLIADITDQPVSVIRDLNPALLKNVAPPGCQLHIPKGTAGFVAAALDLIPPSKRVAWRIHRAADGDTLAGIAKRFGSTVSAITSANAALSEPRSGDLVIVPAAPQASKTVVKRTSSKRSARTSSARRTTPSAARKPAARSVPIAASRKAPVRSARAR
jgi:membrane-bound lytic murein transglycosylase D